MISVKNLSKSYGDFEAVNDVSFDIGRHQIVGLLGHNGAGKTTIMKMLTGFLEPNHGTITIDGASIGEHRLKIQSKVGYLPENCPLYMEMTVIDYLEYAAGLRGLVGKEMVDSVRNVINQTELTTKATHPISTLSRGFQQRVGVAQAILTKPEVLILDEPTNGLDPSQILHMRDLIVEFGTQATVILSTHILQEVQAICDRVLILQGGRLALDSSLSDLNQGQRLFLTIDRRPDEAHAELSRIGGVESVDALSQRNGQFNYALHLAESAKQDLSEAVPSIAKRIIEQGYSLYAIHPEIRDLETIFNQINKGQTTFDGDFNRAA